MKKPVSLRVIAAAAGLTPAAVSMALRNHPRISRATALRVQELARALGYRPNPLLRSVLTHVRNRVPGAGERLALVWFDAGTRTAYERRFRRAARERADELGWGIEELALGPRGLTPSRLEEVLRARGLRGVLFAPLPEFHEVSLPLRWADFAVVATGSGPWTPAFHRCAHHHYLAVRTALAALDAAGIRRPALVYEPEVLARALRMPLAAFLTHHPDPPEAATLTLAITKSTSVRKIREWLRGRRVDALLVAGGRSSLAPSLRSARGPKLVLLDRDPDQHADFAGIEHDVGVIARTSVELLIGQLLRNETGVPSSPISHLCAGRWIEPRTPTG